MTHVTLKCLKDLNFNENILVSRFIFIINVEWLVGDTGMVTLSYLLKQLLESLYFSPLGLFNCWRTVGNSPLKQNWGYCLNFSPSTQNFSVQLVKQKGVSVWWGSANTLFPGTEENYFLFLINWGFSSAKHLSIYWAFNGSPIAFNLEEFTFVTTSASRQWHVSTGLEFGMC